MKVLGRSATSHDQLVAERDDSLAALVVLRQEHRLGALSDADFLALEEGATARAAAALRALEGAEEELTAPSPAAPPRRRRRRWALAVGLLCFVVAAGILVGRFAASRLPGQTITGTEKVNSDQQLAEELLQGRILVSQGQDATALAVFRSVLASQPEQPEALAYTGWLLSLAGAQDHRRSLIEEGRSDISEAVSDDPGYPDAHLFLATILLRYEGDLTDSLVQFRLFLLDHPSQALVKQTSGLIDGAFRKAGLAPPKTT